MKILKLIWIAIIVMALLTAVVSGQSYYGSEGPIPLQVDSLKVTLRFDEDLTYPAQQALLESVGRIVDVVEDSNLIDDFVVYLLSTGDGYDAFLDSLDTLGGIYLVEPYYLMQDGFALPVGEKFCVGFDSTVTMSEIDSINTIYNVIVDREIVGMPNVFVLKNTDSSGYRVLELANVYYGMPQTSYSHPNFGIRTRHTSYMLYDYYNEYQPHTKKVIGNFNAASVWDFAGLTEVVTVAVIDDGVDAHEDLPSSRILPGYDFADNDSDPTPGDYAAHGMGCVGIIGASHTTDINAGTYPSSGVISLAPHVNILPVKKFHNSGQGVTADIAAEAITYARENGADILSNSWGFPNPNFNAPILDDAIERASLFGRNGRGCPVIFAAGNFAISFPGQVGYPANQPGAFSVGATELDDDRWYYSQYGTGLDMVAPSDDGNTVGVWSLDQMGSLGWNPGGFSDCPPGSNDQDYTCRFGGTSAAAPIVSGTAALLLSFDSTLSAQAVYYILRNSAVTELESGTITPPDTAYGYGRVDAFRAILSLARGDMNANGKINLADITKLSAYIYQGGNDPFPDYRLGNCDCDSEGKINLADLNLLIDHVYISKDPLPLPCFVY